MLDFYKIVRKCIHYCNLTCNISILTFLIDLAFVQIEMNVSRICNQKYSYSDRIGRTAEGKMSILNFSSIL